MPTTDVLILLLIIFAFGAFAVILAWGDQQTRDIAKASRPRALAGARGAPSDVHAKPQLVVRKVEEKRQARASLDP